ncbi:hypothetical protein LguiB_013465 [Lonicera macranthoides]
MSSDVARSSSLISNSTNTVSKGTLEDQVPTLIFYSKDMVFRGRGKKDIEHSEQLLQEGDSNLKKTPETKVVEILVSYAWAKTLRQSEFGAQSYGRNTNSALEE